MDWDMWGRIRDWNGLGFMTGMGSMEVQELRAAGQWVIILMWSMMSLPMTMIMTYMYLTSTPGSPGAAGS